MVDQNFSEDEEDEEALGLPEDTLILHLIATGLLQISKRVEQEHMLRAPYPHVLQKGWDRLNMYCYQHQQPLITTLSALFQLCREPMKKWPLRYELAQLDHEDTLLLDGQFITSICESLACVSADVEAEVSEQHFINGVLRACKQANRPDAYVALRRLLIQHPVLTTLQFHEHLERNRSLSFLKNHLKDAYEEAPLEYLHHDTFYGCPRCGNLQLPPNKTHSFRCENERCRRDPSIKPAHPYPASQEVLWLKRGLRRFICIPGQAELWLEQQLLVLGLRVEMWPDFDAYDLRVIFPGETYWAIDVKDWANPFLLAHHVDPIPQAPQCERTYFAFPHERSLLQDNYVRAFCVACQTLFHEGKGQVLIDGQKVRAAFDRDIVADAKQVLAGGTYA